jgi:hypothetical protein
MRHAVYTSLSASVGDSASAQGLTPEDLLELPLVAVLTDDAVGRRAGIHQTDSDSRLSGTQIGCHLLIQTR